MRHYPNHGLEIYCWALETRSTPVLNIIVMCQKIVACVLVESMSIREDKKDIWKFILFVRATKG